MIRKFESLGVQISYNWAKHGQLFDYDSLTVAALDEINGVRNAKCVLVVMPGGRGTHFEMGVAYALGIPIVLLIEDLDNHVFTSFHTLDVITRCYTEDDAFDAVLQITRK